VTSGKIAMKEYWEKMYKPSTISSSTLSATSTPLVTNTRPENDFLQWLIEDDDNEIEDEYERYCSLPQVPGVKNGHKWWLEPTQQKRFPFLSKMALDILSTSAMSAEPERLFSGAKITISACRNRLTIDTIQALHCLKSWLGIEYAVGDDVGDGDELFSGNRGADSGGAWALKHVGG
jgi:hypothetical protein